MIKRVFEFFSRYSKVEKDVDIEVLKAKLDPSRIPLHVAIIMDGNGRWANLRGMPRAYGHRAGVESLREVVRVANDIGLKVLTVYAFSTENWKRPQEEINILMDLLVEYLHKEINDLCKNNVKIRAIGKIGELPPKAREAIATAHEKSKDSTGLCLNIALNYGGRTELVEAVRQICANVANNSLCPEDINQEVISRHLYTAGQPDPDLLIRPSGEYRVSNFLLWQMAYTEFWLSDIMWPDFREYHLIQALVDYQDRRRRFGGLEK